MANIGVAPAATSSPKRAPVPVKKRELLWSGGTVEIKVPVDARYGEFKDGKGNTLPFLKFARSVKGGMINFFVHNHKLECRGRKIKAEVQVWRKEFEDGREFLYIDLRPVLQDTPFTHRLVVMSGAPGTWLSQDGAVFETPWPLQAAIILTAPGKKIEE